MTRSPRGGLDLDPVRIASSLRAPSNPAEVERLASGSANAEEALAAVARKHRVSRILATLDDLPALPTVVLRVMELAGDAEAGAADFEAILRRDPVLAAKVLKLVNSPFFGLRHKITSVSHAVVLLGFKTVRSVVIAAKTSRLLNRQLTQYGFDAGGMWKHSISCAAICHFLAGRSALGVDTREDLFVAGLLHDVGKLVIVPQVASVHAEFREAVRRNDWDVVAVERELLGISHDVVGGHMARRWGLDPALGELIERHHENGSAPPASRALLILRVADDLCHQLGIGRTAGPRAPSPRFREWTAGAGLGGPEDVVREIRGPLAELQSVFESLVSE